MSPALQVDSLPPESQGSTGQYGEQQISNCSKSVLEEHLNLDFSSVQLLSRVQLFATLWTVAHQAPQSMEFSRQEYWSG